VGRVWCLPHGHIALGAEIRERASASCAFSAGAEEPVVGEAAIAAPGYDIRLKRGAQHHDGSHLAFAIDAGW